MGKKVKEVEEIKEVDTDNDNFNYDELSKELENIKTEFSDELDKVNKKIDKIKSLDIDEDTKKDIQNNIRIKIEEDLKEEIKKSNEKDIRRKNFHIFRLDVLVIILLAIIGFLVYRLYYIGDLDNIFDFSGKHEVKEEKEIVKDEPKEEKKNKEWYIKEYSYLLDNIKINNYDLIKKSINVKDISSSDKLAMAYLCLDDNTISKEDMIYQVNNSDLEDKYVSIFGNDKYENASFKANNLKYAYLSSTDTYISLNIDGEKLDNLVLNYIYDIKEEKDNIIISAYIYDIHDNQIYNINNLDKSLGKSKEKIENYFDKLSKVDYIFNKNDKKYYLEKIEVK